MSLRSDSETGGVPGKDDDMSFGDIGLSMRGAAVFLSALVAVGGATGGAEASVIGAWNMNGVDPTISTAFAATTGAGTVDFSGVGTGASVLQGTTLGAQTGELAGDALAVVGTVANGTAIRLDFESFGYQNLVLTFATRRSATGFGNNHVEYWSGLGWTSIGSFNPSTTAWEVQTFDLSSLSLLENNFATLRIVIDGATGSTGSIRFDNFTLSGDAVPAPAGAFALIGLAGCAARRRR